MARTPKAPPPPAPARRGRKPKGAELVVATDNGAEDAQAIRAEAVTVTPDNLLARGKPGRKPKQRPEAAAPALPEAGGEQPSMDLDQISMTVEQELAQDGGGTAEIADPAGSDEDEATTSGDARVGSTLPMDSQDGSDQPKAAARWDRAADTVRFNWPAIEQTAAQGGPNQAMAKLLLAARAEGANSRWPL